MSLVQCLAQDLSRIQRKILRMKVGLGGEKGKNRQEISRVSHQELPECRLKMACVPGVH